MLYDDTSLDGIRLSSSRYSDAHSVENYLTDPKLPGRRKPDTPGKTINPEDYGKRMSTDPCRFCDGTGLKGRERKFCVTCDGTGFKGGEGEYRTPVPIEALTPDVPLKELRKLMGELEEED